MSHDPTFQAANARALGTEEGAEVWSVSQVNALARRLLEDSVPQIWVAGEVSGFKRYPAGHCFFTLRDRGAQLSCVMWSDAARALPVEPPEGMAVHVFGYPSVYERAGRFQFVVQTLSERGEGLWRLAFERIRKKLEAEGLLDPARKRSPPAYPTCVGLVTSIEGAALRDVVSIIRRRAPWLDILVYPARVQGEGAVESIVAALRGAYRARKADVLIVGRGGGSLEDLRAFNDERVARAIARAPVPIISAVGHETDVTLADLVADRRAATPSAAAQLAVPELERVQAQLERASDRLAAALRNAALGKVGRVDALEKGLVDGLLSAIERRKVAISALAERLRALGPIAVLRRGYALALDDEGRVLRNVARFETGMRFALRLQDGSVRAVTEGSREET